MDKNGYGNKDALAAAWELHVSMTGGSRNSGGNRNSNSRSSREGRQHTFGNGHTTQGGHVQAHRTQPTSRNGSHRGGHGRGGRGQAQDDVPQHRQQNHAQNGDGIGNRGSQQFGHTEQTEYDRVRAEFDAMRESRRAERPQAFQLASVHQAAPPSNFGQPVQDFARSEQPNQSFASGGIKNFRRRRNFEASASEQDEIARFFDTTDTSDLRMGTIQYLNDA